MISVQSTSTNYDNNSSNATVIINKPAGLAVGDLMVAWVTVSSGTTNNSITLPAGWTSINFVASNSGVGSPGGSLSYIIATSTEVAATDFTWTWAAATDVKIGGILRLTGQHAVTFIGTSSIVNSSSGIDPITTTTITPADANSMIILAGFTQDFPAIVGYSLTTSSPSFTERWNFSAGVSGTWNGLATGIRPETTATGTASIDMSGSSQGTVTTMVAIYPALVTANGNLLELL